MLPLHSPKVTSMRVVDQDIHYVKANSTDPSRITEMHMTTDQLEAELEKMIKSLEKDLDTTMAQNHYSISEILDGNEYFVKKENIDTYEPIQLTIKDINTLLARDSNNIKKSIKFTGKHALDDHSFVTRFDWISDPVIQANTNVLCRLYDCDSLKIVEKTKQVKATKLTVIADSVVYNTIMQRRKNHTANKRDLQNLFKGKFFNLRGASKLLMPANINENHWVLFVAHIPSKILYVYDSATRNYSNTTQLPGCTEILQCLEEAIYSEDVSNNKNWRAMNLYHVNLQDSSRGDCGVYTMISMEWNCICQGVWKSDIKGQDYWTNIYEWRKRIALRFCGSYIWRFVSNKHLIN